MLAFQLGNVFSQGNVVEGGFKSVIGVLFPVQFHYEINRLRWAGLGHYLLCLYNKNPHGSRARWLMPVIPALWEAEVGRSRSQGFKTSLANKVKSRLYLKIQKIRAWWCTPVIPATWEAEAGELLESRRQRLQ